MLFRPCGPASREDIRRAGGVPAGVFTKSPYHHRIAVEGDAPSKPVISLGIGGNQFLLFRPCGPGSREDIRRAGVAPAGVFSWGPYHHRIAVEGDGRSKPVHSLGIGGNQFLLFRPCGPASREDIRRAGVAPAGVFLRSPNHHRIAGDSDATSKIVISLGIGGI